MPTAAELVVKVSADVANAERELRAFSARALSGSGGVFGGLQMDRLVNAGMRGLTNLGRAVVGIGSDIIKTGMDFEYELDAVQALLGASEEQAVALGEAAMSIALNPNLQVGAEDALGIMKVLAAAGLEASQIPAATETAVLLANATGGQYEQAAEIVTDAVKVFGLGNDQLVDVANGVAGIANITKFNLNDVALGYAQASAAAAMAGIPIEDMNAGLAATASYANSGSDAGTSYKNFLMSLTAPTDKAAKVLNGLGVSVFDANGEMRAFPDIVGDMNQALFGVSEQTIVSSNLTQDQAGRIKHLNGVLASTNQKITDYKNGILGANLSEEDRAAKLDELNKVQANASAELGTYASIAGTTTTALVQLTDAQRVQALETIFGRDGMRAAMAVMSMSEEEYKAFSKAVNEGTDAQELAAIATDNLKSKWQTFLDTIDAQKLRMFAKIQEPLKGVMAQVTPLITLAQPVIDAVGDWGAGIIEDVSGWITNVAIPTITVRVPVAWKAWNAAEGAMQGLGAAYAALTGQSQADLAPMIFNLKAIDTAVSEFGGWNIDNAFTALVGGLGMLAGATTTFNKNTSEFLVVWDNFQLKLNEKGLQGFEIGDLSVSWTEGIKWKGKTPTEVIDTAVADLSQYMAETGIQIAGMNVQIEDSGGVTINGQETRNFLSAAMMLTTGTEAIEVGPVKFNFTTEAEEGMTVNEQPFGEWVKSLFVLTPEEQTANQQAFNDLIVIEKARLEAAQTASPTSITTLFTVALGFMGFTAGAGVEEATASVTQSLESSGQPKFSKVFTDWFLSNPTPEEQADFNTRMQEHIEALATGTGGDDLPFSMTHIGSPIAYMDPIDITVPVNPKFEIMPSVGGTLQSAIAAAAGTYGGTGAAMIGPKVAVQAEITNLSPGNVSLPEPYPANAKIEEPIDWGYFFNPDPYGATAKIGSSPDWGNWTHEYTATVRITGVIDDTGGGGGGGLPEATENATGSLSTMGGWSLVGERGPELVRLPGASRVYTNRDTEGMMRGPQVVVNAIVNSPMDEESLVRRLKRELRRGY